MPDTQRMEDAVHAYVAAFEASDPDAVARLFAVDATVEDPLGTPLHRGRDAIRAFYTQSMATGARLHLDGPIRVAHDQVAFPFSVHLTFDGAPKHIEVIDTFRFNEANEIVEMRAFWGPSNMHGF